MTSVPFISFVSDTPLVHGSPTVSVQSPCYVKLIDRSGRLSFDRVLVTPGNPLVSGYQYYIPWQIEYQYVGSEEVSTYNFDLTDQVVFIKMDGHALGDNIAWIPYVEQFRQVHNCKVICSTFWNELFVDAYPHILFVKPNTKIHNVYAQYYIGAHKPHNEFYCRVDVDRSALYNIASSTLGLGDQYIKCRIAYPKVNKNKRLVSLSQFASSDIKTWKGDWQKVVDSLVSRGFEVQVVSKERTNLTNVTDLSGDHFTILDRVDQLAHSSYFIGCSSGLSWLSNSIDNVVVLISDFTPPHHEFPCVRIYDVDHVTDTVLTTEPTHHVSTEVVISTINQHIV